MGNATVSCLSSMKQHPICEKKQVLSTVVEESSSSSKVMQKDGKRRNTLIEGTSMDLSLMVPGLVQNSATDLSCSIKKNTELFDLDLG